MIAVAGRLQQLTGPGVDSLLCLLMNESARNLDSHSSHHALECAAIVDLCAQQLNYPDIDRQALVLAALTMNVGMTALQNELVHRERTPTLEQRLLIDSHPRIGAEMLAAAGVTDALWLELVRTHHEDFSAGPKARPLTHPQHMATLLRRVDVFTAKITPRATRKGLPPTVAARYACLGPDGRPDDIGTAIIKALGIYPPGSYVLLRNGSIALVVRRGPTAHQPFVAVLTDSERRVLTLPMVVATSLQGAEVKASAGVEEVRAVFSREDMLRAIGLCLQTSSAAATSPSANRAAAMQADPTSSGSESVKSTAGAG